MAGFSGGIRSNPFEEDSVRNGLQPNLTSVFKATRTFASDIGNEWLTEWFSTIPIIFEEVIMINTSDSGVIENCIQI